jgi:hypothetical protein
VDFSYKDVSQLSEATDDVYAESIADEDADLRDYNRLVQQTQKKLTILGKWRLNYFITSHLNRRRARQDENYLDYSPAGAVR